MALNDTGLQFRCYVDEAASGTSPTEVSDDSGVGSPANLTINYGAGSSDLEYTEVSGNRGLNFKDAGGDQRAVYAIGTTGDKIFDNINGAQKLTVEVVVQVSTFSTAGGRVFGINDRVGSDGLLMVRGSDAVGDDFQFYFNNALCRSWTKADNARHVLHILIDTTLATANDRIKVRVNDADASATVDANPAQNDTCDLIANSDDLIMGNRESTGSFARSFTGVEYYAALYSDVMSLANVTNNYGVLWTDDDTPGAPSVVHVPIMRVL